MIYQVLLKHHKVIQDFQVTKFRKGHLAHELTAKITFINQSELRIKDYAYRDQTRKYTYHWQNPDGTLLIRWDNASHWKFLSSYPHHKHVGEPPKIKESSEHTLEKVIEYIAKEIS